jgi:hypothetical protein
MAGDGFRSVEASVQSLKILSQTQISSWKGPDSGPFQLEIFPNTETAGIKFKRCPVFVAE